MRSIYVWLWYIGAVFAFFGAMVSFSKAPVLPGEPGVFAFLFGVGGILSTFLLIGKGIEANCTFTTEEKIIRLEAILSQTTQELAKTNAQIAQISNALAAVGAAAAEQSRQR